jgi:hypothetical protein
MMPISEEEKRKKVRESLLEKYQSGMSDSAKDMAGAEKGAAILQGLNALGRTATDFQNANKRDVILYERMNELGGTPKIMKSERAKWDDEPFEKMSQGVLDRAKSKREESWKSLEREQEAGKWDRENTRADHDDEFTAWERNRKKTRAPIEDAFDDDKMSHDRFKMKRYETRAPVEDQFEDKKMAYDSGEMDRKSKRAVVDDRWTDEERGQKRKDWNYGNVEKDYETAELDPNSKLSKNANLLLGNVLSAKAMEAERAGDKASAKKIREMAKSSNLAAREAYDALKMVQQMDWKDVLSTNLSEARLRRGRALKGPKDDIPDLMARRDMRLKKADELYGLYQAADAEGEVGPIAGRISKFKNQWGLSNSPATDNLNIKMLSALNNYIKEITGATATVGESKRLEAVMGDITNDEKLFRTKLKASLDEADAIIQEKMAARGYRQEMGYSPADGGGGRREVSRKYSPSRNQTIIYYDRGEPEVIDGR